MMKVFTIMVNDTKPLWMYCATKDHCQKGMVMAINAPQSGEKTFASYKALAAKFDPANPNATANSTNGTSGNPGHYRYWNFLDCRICTVALEWI